MFAATFSPGLPPRYKISQWLPAPGGLRLDGKELPRAGRDKWKRIGRCRPDYNLPFFVSPSSNVAPWHGTWLGVENEAAGIFEYG